jgi:hypothetical protein
LSDFFFLNKGLEHESGFFIAAPCIASKHRNSGICPQSTFGGYLNKEDTINLSYFSLVLLEINNLYQYWAFSFVFASIE